MPLPAPNLKAMVQPGKAGEVAILVLTFTVLGVGAVVRMLTALPISGMLKAKEVRDNPVIAPVVAFTVKLVVGNTAESERAVFPAPSARATVKLVKVT